MSQNDDRFKIHLQIYNHESYKYSSEILPPTVHIHTMSDLKDAVQKFYVPGWDRDDVVMVYLGPAHEFDAKNELVRSDAMYLSDLIGAEVEPKFEVYKKMTEDEINMIVIREEENNRVHTLNGVKGQDSVSDLKLKIQEVTGLSPDKQSLSYAGCLLWDEDLLVDFVKGDGKEPKRSAYEIDVLEIDDSNTISISIMGKRYLVEKTSTINSLLDRVSDEYDNDGFQLNGESTIEESRINEGDSLSLQMM